MGGWEIATRASGRDVSAGNSAVTRKTNLEMWNFNLTSVTVNMCHSNASHCCTTDLPLILQIEMIANGLFLTVVAACRQWDCTDCAVHDIYVGAL